MKDEQNFIENLTIFVMIIIILIMIFTLPNKDLGSLEEMHCKKCNHSFKTEEFDKHWKICPYCGQEIKE